jgi:WD40 repeat protein
MERASDEAAAFVKLLSRTIEQKDVPIFIVITMRSEFLGECAQFRDLPEAINNSQYLIPRMTRDEKREAIEGPIAVGGAEISPPLLSRLLNDVGDNPDQLPILQHALMRTWDYWAANHREGEPLGLKHYEAIGTMERALSRHAEEAYAELKTGSSLAICEKMFKLLTEGGETGRGVRRTARVSEICSVTNASEKEVIQVINVFRQPGRTFLMPPGEETLKADSVIDISHESLMRIWTRLIRWVKEESNSAELYIRLAHAAALHREGKAGLWRDPELMLALEWHEKSKPNAEWAQRYDPSFDRAIDFLEAGKKQQEHEIEEKEREQKAKIKRTRIFTTIISITAVIAVVFAGWALENRQEAVRQQKKAEGQRQEAVIQHKKAEEQRKEAVRQRKIAEVEKNKAEKAKRKLEEQTGKTIKALIEKKKADEIALNHKLERIKAEEDLLKKTTQKLIADINKAEATFNHYLAKAKELALHSIPEVRDKELKAQLALTAYRLNNKAYDNLKTNIEALNPRNNPDSVSAAKKLPGIYEELEKKAKNRGQPAEIFEALRKAYIAIEDSKDILYHYPTESWALASIIDDNIVFNNWEGKLLLSSLTPDPNDPKLPVLKKTIPLSKNTLLRASSFAGAEDRLFCGTREGSIIYWEKNNWKKSKLIKKYPDPILAMVYSKNKKWLIYSARDTIYGYSLINKTGPEPVGKKDSFIRAITLVEDEKNSFLIYADSEAGTNKKANIYCRGLPGDIKGEEREIGSFDSGGFHAIAYNYSGNLLALGDENGQIYISDIDCKNLKPGTKPAFHPVNKKHRGIVKALAFSPGGRYMASCSLDNTVMLWDVQGKNAAHIKTMAPVLTIDSSRKILSLVFALKGKYLIFSDQQNLRICPTRPGVFLIRLGKEKRDFTDKEWKDYVGDTIKKEDIIISSQAGEK